MLERLVPALAALLLGGCTAASVPSLPLVATPVPEPTRPPTPAATVSVTATASQSVVPTPTATPDRGVLALEATGCDGGVVLRWSSSTHPDFHHYVALRSPEAEIKPDYPPIASAVDWGDTYATIHS